MATVKVIDKEKKCIKCYLNTPTDETFWDERWEKLDLKKFLNDSSKTNSYLYKTTRKYLSPPASVLEGGCGIGQLTFELEKHGFDAYGVDYAQAIVEKVNEKIPDLKISYDNLENLNITDDFFDGFWSPGVIEHDINGYSGMLNEMKRVIKPGGYLFLTHPQMNPLRRLKMKFGIYKRRDVSSLHFYQYIYEPKYTINIFQEAGFDLVKRHSNNGIKGVIDEIRFFNWALSPFVYYRGNNLFKKVIKGLTYRIFNGMFSGIAGYTTLLIFRKRDSNDIHK